MTDSIAAPDPTPAEMLAEIAEIREQVAAKTGASELPNDRETLSELAHLAGIMPEDD